MLAARNVTQSRFHNIMRTHKNQMPMYKV